MQWSTKHWQAIVRSNDSRFCLDCIDKVSPELKNPQSVLAIVERNCDKGCGGKFLPAFGCYTCARREDRCAKCWGQFPYKTRIVDIEPLESDGKDFVLVQIDTESTPDT